MAWNRSGSWRHLTPLDDHPGVTMVLSEDLQRDLHHAVRQVEEDGRAVVRRIEAALPLSERRRIRVLLAKLEVFVSDAEKLLFLGDEPVDREIEELNDKFDALFLQRAELDRDARRIRRETQSLALDRRELHNQQKLDELEVIERQLRPLGG